MQSWYIVYLVVVSRGDAPRDDHPVVIFNQMHPPGPVSASGLSFAQIQLLLVAYIDKKKKYPCVHAFNVGRGAVPRLEVGAVAYNEVCNHATSP